MKKFIFPLLAAIFAFAASIAQPTLQWATRVTGQTANDQGKMIAVDLLGNVYVVASSDGTASTDFLTIKYDPNGNVLWSERYNGNANGEDIPTAIKVDPNGNVYVIGKSQNNTGRYDMVTIKYNAMGVQQWISIFNTGAVANFNSYDLVIDVFGNIYVVGGAVYLSGSNSSDGIVVKYNVGGVKQWSVIINEYFNTEYANLVAINAFGNIIVVTNLGIFDSYHVLELNPLNGDKVFTYNQSIAPTFFIAPGIPNALALDGVGNIYVVSTEDEFTGNPIEVWTTKFNYHIVTPSRWGYSYTTNVGRLTGIDLKVDANSNAYTLSDYYNGSNHEYYLEKYAPGVLTEWRHDYNPIFGIDDNPVSFALSNLTIPPDIFVTGYTGGNGNIHTVKYSNAGDLLWDKAYDCGNNGIDIATKMVTDICDNIYITGSSNCNGTYNDVKTIKYSNSQLPTIAVNGSTTFCKGESRTLTTDACVGCSYLWSTGQTTQSISVSPPVTTTYQVTINYQTGCGASSLGTVLTVNPTPIVTVSTNADTLCNGASAILTATGGTSYQWSTGQTTPSITINPSATTMYTVTGTTSGCTSMPVPIQIKVKPAPTITLSNVTICKGESATLTANGNATNYLWNGGTTGNTITVSPSTTTTYTVTGSLSGCTSTKTATVTVNLIPVVDVNSPTICEGQTATLTAHGATGYLWNTGQMTPSIVVSPTTTTIYTVTGTSLGCTSPPVSAQVTVKTLPVVSLSLNGASVCQGGTVLLSVTAPVGSTYKWSTNAISKSITVPIGTYTVTVTGSNGCTASASTTISSYPVPQAAIVPPSATFCKGDSVTLAVNPALGSYSWSTGSHADHITVGLGGNYTVTLTDTNGCTGTAFSTVTVIPLPTATVTHSGSTTLCDGEMVTLSANPNSPQNQYLWSNASTSQSITVSSSGTYMVTVTALGCSSASPSVLVQVVPLPTVNFSTDTIALQAGQTLVPNYAGTGLKYLWSTGAMTSTIGVGNMGTYSMTVTDVNGCTASASVFVKITIGFKDVPDEFSGKIYLIYPNPTSETVSIAEAGKGERSHRAIYFALVNTMGQKVGGYMIQPYKGVVNISLQGISSGIYSYEIKAEERVVQIGKLIKL